MQKSDLYVLIDNGHGIEQLANCSPDHRLYEYKFARQLAQQLEQRLKAEGFRCVRLVPEVQNVSIRERVRRANDYCRRYGAKRCVLVSIHSNSIGAAGQWTEANGFSVFTSKAASNDSKQLAELMYQEAVARRLMGDRVVPRPDAQGRHFWTWSWRPDDIGILTQTACPAVLTENMFHNNRRDVDFMLSQEGQQQLVDLHVRALERYCNS